MYSNPWETGTGKLAEVFEFEDFSKTVKIRTNRLICATFSEEELKKHEKYGIFKGGKKEAGRNCGIIHVRENKWRKKDGTINQRRDHGRF